MQSIKVNVKSCILSFKAKIFKCNIIFSKNKLILKNWFNINTEKPQSSQKYSLDGEVFSQLIRKITNILSICVYIFLYTQWYRHYNLYILVYVPILQVEYGNDDAVKPLEISWSSQLSRHPQILPYHKDKSKDTVSENKEY